jgi:hypothetical protein
MSNLLYEKNKGIYEIYNLPTSDVLRNLSTKLPATTIIWAGVANKSQFESYINLGFDCAYFTDKSPLGKKFDTVGIAFFKQNNSHKKLDELSVRNKILYMKSQENKQDCQLFARFSKSAIFFMKNLVIKNDISPIYTKELSATLYISKILNINNKIIFELSENIDSVIKGDDEQVKAIWSRYNLHTHPNSAYVNNSVTNGWPSSQDFIGFIELNNHTIFHTVVTLEGIYVISWARDAKKFSYNTKNIDKKQISTLYHIDHKEDITPQEFVNRINSIKYKGYTLFNVIFMSWDSSIVTFPIVYKKTGSNCLPMDKEFNIHST